MTLYEPAARDRRPFSVIMLLPEHRGHFASAIAGWTTSQLYPDDRFELIVATDGAEPDVEQAARAMLRPHDRMIVAPGAKRSGLLDRAARAARFDQLVFTESHVEADADFLRELDEWLWLHPDLAGACCRTMPSYATNYAWFDAVLHEEGYRVYRSDDDWRKINIHAFTLSRDWFLRAGGLDETYNLFAEMILAANLRDLGGRMGYAPGPAVLHHFRVEVDGPEESIREFIRDESNYRRAHPGPDQLGFSVLPDVSSLTATNSGLWRSGLMSALRRARSHRPSRRLLPTLAWNALKEFFAAGGPRFAARRVGWEIFRRKMAARLWRWNRARLEPHYRRLWSLYGIHERLLSLADENVEAETSLDVSDEPQFLSADVGRAVAGLHDLEIYLDQPFRWTQPISVWRLIGLASGCSLRFQTHAVRGDVAPGQVIVLCNGEPIPTLQIQIAPDGLTIDLAGVRLEASKPAIVLLCVPALPTSQKGRHDPRALGLPVVYVELQSAAVSHWAAA